MPINNGWIKIGAFVAAMAVVLGGLDWHQAISPGRSSIGEAAALEAAAISTAVYFQFVHALAIILVGVLGVLRPSRLLWINAFCFLIGVILFSGSVYLSVVFVDVLWLQYVKLAGVFTLACAWILLVEAGCPGWNKKEPDSVNPTSEESSE